MRCKLLAQLRGLEAVLDAGSAPRGCGADQCWTLARMAEVGRCRFGLGGKVASLCLLLYRIGWSVQVAARPAAGRERRRSPSGEKRPGRWQRTAGDLGALEVLRLLAAGRSNRGIAHDLVVALDTVKKHVTHLRGKLGAANSTEAAARARQLGLIP